MEFYEVMFLADGCTDAKEIEVRATGAAERCDDHFAVVSATIHARPNQFDVELSRHTAVVMVMVPNTWDDPRFDEFAGKMARLYGVPMIGATHLQDETLNFKSDEQAIENFKADALGRDASDEFEAQPGETRADRADETSLTEETFTVEVTPDSDTDYDEE
ncbi:hypothetical protein [Halorussus sp. MSC15.2]|uniref:hypothetical protein n=1 Tax=Halorussus sp. MSC15.2 TaxID=2283638 RepID=UPI0013D44E69|nr:hypothetical protein [Halorussus sp. MSC15.2]NEU58604.1 hypothetical protein [Halorussus sp. MSC15.2]